MNAMEFPAARVLRLEPLTAAAFAPFGEIVTIEGKHATPVNEGRALRYDKLVNLANRTEASVPELSIYHVAASSLPVAVDLFEQHPHSGQVFLPMINGRFLVIVAPDRDRKPDRDGARAFMPDPGIGVHYKPGIWHVPMTAVGADMLLAMLMWEGRETPTIEHRLSDPILIQA
jgi:ureidoglycolate lyase